MDGEFVDGFEGEGVKIFCGGCVSGAGVLK